MFSNVASVVNTYDDASIVQWLEFVPSKHEVRVRFPVDALHIRVIRFDSESERERKRDCRACGVMVSTLDSESNDPGSNPGRAHRTYFGSHLK